MKWSRYYCPTIILGSECILGIGSRSLIVSPYFFGLTRLTRRATNISPPTSHLLTFFRFPQRLTTSRIIIQRGSRMMLHMHDLPQPEKINNLDSGVAWLGLVSRWRLVFKLCTTPAPLSHLNSIGPNWLNIGPNDSAYQLGLAMDWTCQSLGVGPHQPCPIVWQLAPETRWCPMPAWRPAIGFASVQNGIFVVPWRVDQHYAWLERTGLFEGEIGRILGWGTSIHTKVRSAVVFFHDENRVDGRVELVGGFGNALFFFLTLLSFAHPHNPPL